ncbi:hypothetical protein EW145_g1335 [Phellinidium pouzarii]|uniref:ARID domain-containing protein n=1 Tax=Phellinidium pouzarii TaxID=167371 RepID=A0A4S4LEY6_9AGAM|nr:hypothetical protein EW145_g1335 [Phellinidium pouzarii]
MDDPAPTTTSGSSTDTIEDPLVRLEHLRLTGKIDGISPGQANLDQTFQPESPEGQDYQSMSFPSLTRQRFLAMLGEWWDRNGTRPDPATLILGNRRIDLYELHVEMLHIGGATVVKRQELWGVIAARLGWTDAATSDASQVTAAQAANHIKVVYEQFIEPFQISIIIAYMKQFSGLLQPNQQNAPNSQQQQTTSSSGPLEIPNPNKQQTSLHQDSQTMHPSSATPVGRS